MDHRFEKPLVRGILLRRYKRFLADVELANGDVEVVHCANTGSMRGCSEPGSPVYISRSDNPKRKLQYSLELVETPTSIVGVNTALPNRIVEAAILRGGFRNSTDTADSAERYAMEKIAASISFWRTNSGLRATWR